jgi:DNA-binding SARP family transcriptional activator/tetratricopeptide (TPR) repeat protein
MQVRLLGPVDVTVDGMARPVSGLRRKAVLAVLALHAGQVVSTDRLIDVVWPGKVPDTALNTLQSHVSYLRGAIGERAAIVARPPGYVLSIGAEATDVEVAERLIGQGERCADEVERVRHLQSALALWRGPALTDVAGLAWLDEQAERLEQVRLVAVRGLVDARLALGEHVQVVPELESLAQQHPFDEHIHRQLMLALYRAGRQGDALQAYRRLRQALNENLGIDPGVSVRDLETAILRQDRELSPTRPSTTAVPPSPAGSLPAQLPLVVRAFAGRVAELTRLDALLAETGQGAAVPIAAVSGTAGVGKTTLAVHWAHRVAERFPDGQLYVNLRGFDPGGSVTEPAQALRGFLDAFGVAADRIPLELERQVALYRSVLAGKRVLVVLDNARDAEQVRPLLPGAPGCLVIVTSRDQLVPLVASEGAHLFTLDLLTPDEARDLLAGRLGFDRVASESEAVDEIIARCARLPLALCVAAVHIATRRGLSLGLLAAQLRAATDQLDAFDGGDPATDMRAVFSWSYRTLSGGAANLFRLLGLHPGPDIAAPAAASLAGVPTRQAQILLIELARAHLLTEHTPGRYALHDLLRIYAGELVHGLNTETDRHAANLRMLDHYLHTARACAQVNNVHWDPIVRTGPQIGVVAEAVAGPEFARDWLVTEYPVLRASIGHAASNGHDSHTWQLAWTLTDFFERRGHWQHWNWAQGVGLEAAQRLGDERAQAELHRGLGGAFMWQEQFLAAHECFHDALDLFGSLRDEVGRARTHHDLCLLSDRQGDHQDALDHGHRALELYQSIGDKAGYARELNAVGWCYAALGDYQHALDSCQQALALQQELRDHSQEGATWDSLGYAYHHLGRYGEAAGCYRHAIDLSRQLGNRYCEASCLLHLGDTHRAVGIPAEARDVWRRAQVILDEIAHPDAEHARARLELV